MRFLLHAAALSPKSKKNDAGCLRSWERFCSEHSLPVLPTTLEALRVYITDMPTRVTAATLRHVVATVRRWHVESGLPDPANEVFFEEMRRAQRRCRIPELVPCLTHDLATLIDSIPKTPAGIRDVLLVLLSYVARVSSTGMSKLDRTDVHIDSRGMRLYIWYGRRRYVITITRYHDTRYCVVSAMERYLRLIDDEEPVLIRVCRRGRITRRRLTARRGVTAIRFRFRKAGLLLPGVTSLRAGMMVAATNRGAEDYAIMRQQGYNRMTVVRDLQARLQLKQVDVVEKLGM